MTLLGPTALLATTFLTLLGPTFLAMAFLKRGILWLPAGLRATYIGTTNQPASGRSKNRAIPTNQQEETMRRFMVRLVTVVDFEDGDEASDETVQNYQNHL